MHNHTCGCGHHEGDAGCGSREHHHGEACACGGPHEAPEVEPLASTWSMLSKSAQEQTVPPKCEFDFDWEGQKIHVYQWGKPENIPVVLLHGFMQTGLSWSLIAAALSGNHCAYALDFLGHGRSSKPGNVELYRYDSMVRMVESFLEQVACVGPEGAKRRAHVIGYSMGGRVALGLASSEKDLLYSLILEAAILGPKATSSAPPQKSATPVGAQRLRDNGIEEFVEYWEAAAALRIAA